MPSMHHRPLSHTLHTPPSEAPPPIPEASENSTPPVAAPGADAAPPPGPSWIARAVAALQRAEKHITANFRVPPSGG